MTPIAVNNALTSTDNSGSAVDFFTRVGASTRVSFADICQEQMSRPMENGATAPEISVPTDPDPAPVTISVAPPKASAVKSGQKDSSSEGSVQGILLAIPVLVPVLSAVAAPVLKESADQGMASVLNLDSVGAAASSAGSPLQLAQADSGPPPLPSVPTEVESYLGGVMRSDLSRLNRATSANVDVEPVTGGTDTPLAADQSAAWNRSMPSAVASDPLNRIVETTERMMEATPGPAPEVLPASNGEVSAEQLQVLSDRAVREQSQSGTSGSTFENWIARIAPGSPENSADGVTTDSSVAPTISAAAPAGQGDEKEQVSGNVQNDSPEPATKTTVAAAPTKVLKNAPKPKFHGIGSPDTLTTAAGTAGSSTEKPFRESVSSTLQTSPEIAAPVPLGFPRVFSPQVDQGSSAPIGEQKPLTNLGSLPAASGNGVLPGVQNSPRSTADETSEPSIDGASPLAQRKNPENGATANASNAAVSTVAIPFSSHDPKSAGIPAPDSSAPQLTSNDASGPADRTMRQATIVRTQQGSGASPVQLAQIVNKASQSEMRIGLNTPAFGSVEVRTVVHASDVGVVIGSEKGDLRSLLANDLPGIANTLQQQNLRLTQVSFQQQGFASAGGFSSGGDAHSHSFAPRTSPGALLSMTAVSDDNGQSLESGFATIRHDARGLSVLA